MTKTGPETPELRKPSIGAGFWPMVTPERTPEAPEVALSEVRNLTGVRTAPRRSQARPGDEARPSPLSSRPAAEGPRLHAPASAQLGGGVARLRAPRPPARGNAASSLAAGSVGFQRSCDTRAARAEHPRGHDCRPEGAPWHRPGLALKRASPARRGRRHPDPGVRPQLGPVGAYPRRSTPARTLCADDSGMRGELKTGATADRRSEAP